MGLYRLRGAKDDFLFRAAIFAHSLGITPNAMTILGLCFGVSAGAMFWIHQMLLGFALGFISVFCDVLDGTIARKFNLETLRGKVFDSASDRISELAVVLGALGGEIIELWGIIAIVGSATLFLFRVISYRRGVSTDYVLLGRTERLFFIMMGLLIPWATASTICFILAGVFGFISSIQIAANLSRRG
jgi:phosphatidylglycerophosphate synthase